MLFGKIYSKMPSVIGHRHKSYPEPEIIRYQAFWYPTRNRGFEITQNQPGLEFPENYYPGVPQSYSRGYPELIFLYFKLG